MKQEINAIINKACRGYVWGEMYVSQIWQVINKQDLPEAEKQRALFKYIRELEYATDWYDGMIEQLQEEA